MYSLCCFKIGKIEKNNQIPLRTSNKEKINHSKKPVIILEKKNKKIINKKKKNININVNNRKINNVENKNNTNNQINNSNYYCILNYNYNNKLDESNSNNNISAIDNNCIKDLDKIKDIDTSYSFSGKKNMQKSYNFKNVNYFGDEPLKSCSISIITNLKPNNTGIINGIEPYTYYNKSEGIKGNIYHFKKKFVITKIQKFNSYSKLKNCRNNIKNKKKIISYLTHQKNSSKNIFYMKKQLKINKKISSNYVKNINDCLNKKIEYQLVNYDSLDKNNNSNNNTITNYKTNYNTNYNTFNNTEKKEKNIYKNLDINNNKILFKPKNYKKLENNKHINMNNSFKLKIIFVGNKESRNKKKEDVKNNKGISYTNPFIYNVNEEKLNDDFNKSIKSKIYNILKNVIKK